MRRQGCRLHQVEAEEFNDGFDLTVNPPQPLPAFLDRYAGLTLWGEHDGCFHGAFLNPMFRLLFVRRDFRDAAASLRRLNGASIDLVCGLVDVWYRIHKAMQMVPAERVLALDYAEVLDVAGLTRRLAAFLGAELSENDVRQFESTYSKAPVAGRLSEIRGSIFAELEDLAGRGPGDGSVEINLMDGTGYRPIAIPGDLLTPESREAVAGGGAAELALRLPKAGGVVLGGNHGGGRRYRITRAPDLMPWQFNLDHVTAPVTPPWREAFSPDEIERIEALTDPMRRDLGY